MSSFKEDVVFADGTVKTVVADSEEELAEGVGAVKTDRPLKEAKAPKKKTSAKK